MRWKEYKFMPCPKCGEPLFGFSGQEKTICKNCDDVKILTFEESIKFCDVSLNLAKKYFEIKLKKYNSKSLLLHLLNYREKVAYDFLMNKHYLSVENFLAVNDLIKKLPVMGINGKDENLTERLTKEIVDAYCFYTSFVSWKIHIQEGLALFTYNKKVNFDTIDIEYLLTHKESFLAFISNFTLIYNENIEFIFGSFKGAQHLSKNEVVDYMEEHSKEYEEVRKKASKEKTRKYSTKEYINLFYDMLISLYSGLLRNQAYVDVFNIEYLKNTNIKPRTIVTLKNQFPQKDNLLSVIKENEFIESIKKLGYGQQEIFDNMVFSFSNYDIFPFFVKINGNIIGSHYCTYLMYMLSYCFLEFETFQIVHEEKSRIFEQEVVKNEFIKIGYDYKENQKPKKSGLEIDGLAQKENKLLVIEVKHWKIQPYFEQMRIHRYRERDLKGVVDGIKYTTKNGEIIKTKIPSLIEKMEYVKNNLEIWNFDKIDNLQIMGFVVTKSIPPLRKYKDISFISVDEIKGLA